MLASADCALGFQWLAAFHWLEDHPAIHRLLSISYKSLLPELMILAGWLAWCRYEQRIQEFFFLACLSI
jgi:hypothetical protein